MSGLQVIIQNCNYEDIVEDYISYYMNNSIYRAYPNEYVVGEVKLNLSDVSFCELPTD